MLGLIKNIFIAAMIFAGYGSLISLNLLEYVSMSNQEYKVRPAMVNINCNEPLFYYYSILVNKCSGNCNDINNTYAKLCVPDIVKNMNIKIFNLLSKTNKMRCASWHEACRCKYRLDAIVCNDRQRWNSDKCRYELLQLLNLLIPFLDFVN